ncbi:MAG: MFS transporter [Verrucomicrobiota bacterium]
MFRKKPGKSPMEHHQTKPEDRVHPLVKTAYGGGMIPFALLASGYVSMVGPIFNINLGISPAVIGVIAGLSRLWDAINDPMMGKISDNTRSRYGRRRPWILLGSFTAAASFAAIWWFPLGQSDLFYGIWLAAATFLFYIGLTIYTVPYTALGMEMSPDYHERTRIVAYRDFLAPLGTVLAGSLFWFSSWKIHSDVVEGMRFTSLGIGVLIILLGVFAAVFPREHPFAQKSSQQEKIGLFKSVRQTLRVKPFLILCGVSAIMLMGISMVVSFGFYIYLYHLFGGDQSVVGGFAATGTLIGQVSSMALVPFIVKVSTKIGKKKTIMLFICVSIAGSLMKWWFYTPEYPWLAWLVAPFLMLGFIAQSVMVNSMLPDIIDYDELRTHTRREGMFGAVYGWSWKLGISLALVVSGFLLSSTGYDADLGTQQLASTITKMRLLDIGVPILGCLAGLLLIRLYPLDEQKAYEMRAELEKRHASAPLSPAG